jgi:hypothetical protein
VSQQSAQNFGRSSPFFVPHNLYYDLADPSLIPNIHQIFALSRITNYRLYDWLAVFGFDLDAISRLQLLVPRQRTTLLDSSVYDPHVCVPWFAQRRWLGPLPPIAPLGQLLTSAAPRPATEILALGTRRFLYVKVGQEDVLAFPYLAPGSIVRVDVKRSAELESATNANAETRFFLVEHGAGFTCSQLVVLEKGTIMLHSAQVPCAQIELKLDKDARILGVIDAEIRPLRNHHSALALSNPTLLLKPGTLHGRDFESNLSNLLRISRTRVGLSFREASAVSRWIANMLSDELYFAAASTLSDYETLSVPPRHIQKIIALCVLYCIDFPQFLRASGLPPEQDGHDPIPDELVPRHVPSRGSDLRMRREEESAQQQSDFLGSLLKQWEEVPLFLRRSLTELAGLKRLSLSDVFWVGGDEAPIHPWLINATFVIVNRRIKKPAQSTAEAICEQPLYLILKRDGGYMCGRCALHQGNLVVQTYPGGPLGARRFRNGTDAEVIGRVTTILRRLV